MEFSIDMKFKEYPLDNRIKRGISDLGFIKPLEVQLEAVPKILEGKDLIVQSQTGSGKTAAFGIPICQQLDETTEAVQALILTPTRELTVQVSEELAAIGRYKELSVEAIVGKESMQEQRRALKQNPHIIVATPGRIMDHIINKNVKLDDVKYLVIDEADEMLIMGFKEQLEAIIEKLPKERVTLLFSATMPEQVRYLSELFMKSPEQIEVTAEVSTVEKIEQIYYAVDGLKKSKFLKQMLMREDPRKAIIFLNTREQVDTLYDEMKTWGYYVTAIHGGVEQKERQQRINNFKCGRARILLSTDLASRGLHVHDLTHVINYGVPFENEQYVHRIGRTGRVDQNGIAITLVTSRDAERFEQLQAYLGYKIPCKGGHLTRRGKKTNETVEKRQRFKSDSRRKDKVTLEINAGRLNSMLRSKDVLSALKSVSGVDQEHIGKITVKDKTTTVEIYDGREAPILRAFKTKKIRNQAYRVRVQNNNTKGNRRQ
ncbi:MAG: DEAD/DEAH box helicase [Clostridia bacterium]|nr:DEAD/DEAH box helicase [Clostridia bacterium]